MSRQYQYHQGFQPDFHYSYLPLADPSDVLRSYNHSSDESETGGGGGGHENLAVYHEGSFDSRSQTSIGELSYPSPREHAVGQQTQGNREQYYNSQASSPDGSYNDHPSPNVSHDARPPRRRSPYSVPPSDRLNAMQHDRRRVMNEHDRWNASLSSRPQDYPRNMPMRSPDHEMISTLPNLSSIEISQNMGRLTQSSPLLQNSDHPINSLFPTNHPNNPVYPQLRSSLARPAPPAGMSHHPSMPRPSMPGSPIPPATHARIPRLPSIPGSRLRAPSAEPELKHSPESDWLNLDPITNAEIEAWLRKSVGIPEGQQVGLWALDDPPHGERPILSQKWLMALAIFGSPERKLTLRQIYTAVRDRFSYYRETPDHSWMGSMRHNLSLHNIFRSVRRPISEPGKGGYWTLDLSRGETGYKRIRKRNMKPKNMPTDVQEDEDQLEDDDYDDVSPPSSDNQSDAGQSPYGSPVVAAPHPAYVSINAPASSSARMMTTSPLPMEPPSLVPFGGSAYDLSTRQPAFGQPSMGPCARSQSQPMFASQRVSTPTRSHSENIPAPGMYGAMPALRPASAHPMMEIQEEYTQRGQGAQGNLNRNFDPRADRARYSDANGKGKGRAN